MVTNNNVLKNYITGAVRFEECDGFLFPRRFTKQQADYYANNDFINARSKMSAGIILEFNTNTQKIEFDAIFLEASRNYYSFDVYVDGFMVYNFSKENIKYATEEHIEIELKDGTKQVQIYFPCLVETGIKCFCIDDHSSINKIERNKTILFLGDSITHGYASKFTSL